MKNQKNAMKVAILSAITGLALMSANANTINLAVDPNFPPGTTGYVFGNVNPGLPADDASKVAFINELLTLNLGASAAVNLGVQDNTVYRSMNTFSGLPTSVSATGAVDGNQNTTQFTVDGTFAFLVAKYDGPNGGLSIWYIGGLAVGTVIDIPANAFGDANDQYGLSGTALIQGSTQSVPDGASTLMLLGLAGLATVAFKRQFKSEAQKA